MLSVVRQVCSEILIAVMRCCTAAFHVLTRQWEWCKHKESQGAFVCILRVKTNQLMPLAVVFTDIGSCGFFILHVMGAQLSEFVVGMCGLQQW